MATNEETYAAGTDTRPPMLVEDDYESWKIRIQRNIRAPPTSQNDKFVMELEVWHSDNTLVTFATQICLRSLQKPHQTNSRLIGHRRLNHLSRLFKSKKAITSTKVQRNTNTEVSPYTTYGPLLEPMRSGKYQRNRTLLVSHNRSGRCRNTEPRTLVEAARTSAPLCESSTDPNAYAPRPSTNDFMCQTEQNSNIQHYRQTPPFSTGKRTPEPPSVPPTIETGAGIDIVVINCSVARLDAINHFIARRSRKDLLEPDSIHLHVNRHKKAPLWLKQAPGRETKWRFDFNKNSNVVLSDNQKSAIVTRAEYIGVFQHSTLSWHAYGFSPNAPFDIQSPLHSQEHVLFKRRLDLSDYLLLERLTDQPPTSSRHEMQYHFPV
ncbi:hypothetical protein Tco_1265767 [Tanacetum coccineum]